MYTLQIRSVLYMLRIKSNKGNNDHFDNIRNIFHIAQERGGLSTRASAHTCDARIRGIRWELRNHKMGNTEDTDFKKRGMFFRIFRKTVIVVSK